MTWNVGDRVVLTTEFRPHDFVYPGVIARIYWDGTLYILFDTAGEHVIKPTDPRLSLVTSPEPTPNPYDLEEIQ